MFARLSAFLVAAAVLLTAPGFAHAQGNQSQGYKFREAVRAGDKPTEVIEMLNKAGTTVINSKSETNGETALHIVTQQGNEPYLTYLLAQGADPNIRDNAGVTPLLIAASKGRNDLVEQLIAGRANVNLGDASRQTALIRAVQRRDLQMVNTLLTAGADPDQVDLSGLSARDYARQDSRSPAIAKVMADAPKKARAAVAGPKF